MDVVREPVNMRESASAAIMANLPASTTPLTSSIRVPPELALDDLVPAVVRRAAAVASADTSPHSALLSPMGAIVAHAIECQAQQMACDAASRLRQPMNELMLELQHVLELRRSADEKRAAAERAAVVRARALLARRVERFWTKRVPAVNTRMIMAAADEAALRQSRDRQDQLVRRAEEVLTSLARRSGGVTKGESPFPDVVTDRSEAIDVDCTALALLDTNGGSRALRPYQRSALAWLINRYDRNLNCILADEMGLGKTVQAIALLAAFAEHRAEWGPHLVVVPPAVLYNWAAEFRRWAPGFRLLIYAGLPAARMRLRRGWCKEAAVDVCITTYDTLLADRAVFRRRPWGFLIVDEAHQLKSMAGRRWRGLFELRTRHRLLLTGTPLQTSVTELWSLLRFVMPDALAATADTDFDAWFVHALNTLTLDNAARVAPLVRQLHTVLRPFLLRRLKVDVERDLPHKHEIVVMCELTRRQRAMYDTYMRDVATRANITGGNCTGLMRILMALRKVCNHPDLFADPPVEVPLWLPPLAVPMPGCALEPPDLPTALAEAPRLSCYSHNRLPVSTAAESSVSIYCTTWRAHELSKCAERWCYGSRRSESKRLRGYQERIEVPSLLCPVPRACEFLQPMDADELAASLCGGWSGERPVSRALAGVLEYPAWPGGVGAVPQLYLSETVARASEIAMAELERGIGGCPTEEEAMVSVPEMIPWLETFPSLAPHWARYAVDAMEQTRKSRARQLRRQLIQAPCDAQAAEMAAAAFAVSRLLHQPSHSSSHVAGSDGGDSALHAFSTLPHVTDIDLSPPKPARGRPAKRSRSATKPTRGRLPFVGHVASALLSSGSLSRHRTIDALEDSLAPLLDCFSIFIPPVAAHPPFLSLSTFRRQLDFTFSRLVATGTPYLPSLLYTQLTTLVTSSRLPPPVRYFISSPPLRHASASASVLSEARTVVVRPLEHTGPQGLRLSVHSLFHELSRRTLRFPDPRRVTHGSGKLQLLRPLLHQLRQDGHRCLIFTQFTRMLSILERFLALYGLSYLRLDGQTRPEHRLEIIERFNRDERVFCLILSTRSGGIGLNLIGADTVIFYDSDWNPAMDLQAQDRCHRIGQTKDVTIYRLVSRATVESGILQRARDRKLLNNVLIRGGGFHRTSTATAQQPKAQRAVHGTETCHRPSGITSDVDDDDAWAKDLTRFFHNLDEDALGGSRVVLEEEVSGSSPGDAPAPELPEEDGVVQRAMAEAEDVDDQLAAARVAAETRLDETDSGAEASRKRARSSDWPPSLVQHEQLPQQQQWEQVVVEFPTLVPGETAELRRLLRTPVEQRCALQWRLLVPKDASRLRHECFAKRGVCIDREEGLAMDEHAS